MYKSTFHQNPVFVQQIWVLMNRDDPYTTFFSGQVHPYKNLYQVVFTSGTATLPSYLMVSRVMHNRIKILS